MDQCHGKNTTRRAALRFPISSGDYDMYRFKVKPESFEIDAPQRTSITRSKSDIIVEDYGKDIEPITFSGTTGFRVVKSVDGTKTRKQKLEVLQHRQEAYAKQGGDGCVAGAYIELYHFTDHKYYKVHLTPQGLKISRSKDESLLYRYEITLVVIGNLAEVDRGSVTSAEFGNVKEHAKQRVDEGVNAIDSNARKTRNKNGQIISQLDNKSSQSTSNSSTCDSRDTTAGTLRVGRHIRTGGSLGNRDGMSNIGIYNPRQNTNGLISTVDDMALKKGPGDGGEST
ncbi:structural protein [Staphylococcus phage vB_SauH_DELF3]|nr:structural protein [Staphylococcus phage vB_SauH_DELF3]